MTSRAVGRRGGLSLRVAQLAPCVREPPLELAHLVAGSLGLGRAPLGVAPARFGFPSATRALRLFLGARGLGLLVPTLRAFPAAQEVQLLG